jgi:hypothetical protein
MEPCTHAIYTGVMTPSSRWPLIAAALCSTFAAWAQTAPLPSAWKWRDASGQIVVSDTPPPMSVPDKSILERPPVQRASAAAAAAAASAPAPRPTVDNSPKLDPELEARRKAAANEQAAQAKADEQRSAAVRAENCSRATSQLTALVDGQRMVRTNEKGEREVMDDKARAEETQRARAVIASDCR